MTAPDKTAPDKTALREDFHHRRRMLAPARRVHETGACLAELLEVVGTGDRPLAAYCAVRAEIDLAALVHARWQRDLPVWLPRIAGRRRLVWHAITDRSQLRIGRYGIPEPDPRHAPLADLPLDSLLLVPGIAFGPEGRRLGQGGGYYDAVLARLPAGGEAIGVGFSCQWCDEIPEEAHDARVRRVLLGGVWRC